MKMIKTVAVILSCILLFGAGFADAGETDPAALIEMRGELEQEQLIEYDQERQQELMEIVTDLSLESQPIKTMAETIIKDLSANDSLHALKVILAEQWRTTMLPELVIGQRNYHMERGEISADIIVASDELGNMYTAVRCYNDVYGLVYLEVSKDAVRYLILNRPGVAQRSNFVTQTLFIEDMSFVANAGVITEDGLLTGNLEVYLSYLAGNDQDSEEDSETEESKGMTLEEAWKIRYDRGYTYKGKFDGEGHPQIDTPEELKEQGQLCYAIQDRGNEIMYLFIEADPDYVFTGKVLGVYTIWDEIMQSDQAIYK